jgi:hypothetical protein
VEVVPVKNREVELIFEDGNRDLKYFLDGFAAYIKKEPEDSRQGDSGEVSVEWMLKGEIVAVWGLAMDDNHSEGGTRLLGVCEDTPNRSFRDGTLYSNRFPEKVLEKMKEPNVVDARIDGKGGFIS